MTETASRAVVMIVDDTPANLEVLNEILSLHGYAIKAFPDGARALAALDKGLPDLILLDVMMPGMNGYAVCEQIKSRQDSRHIPIIFISALGDTESKIKGFSAGGVDYVTKPFQQAEVLARVHAHLTIGSLQRELKQHNTILEKAVQRRTYELSLANERLIDLSRLKDEFMRMISHEIRTPANGLLGMGELIISESSLSPSGELYRDLFRESGNRLLQLIDDAHLIMEDTIRTDPTDYGYSLADTVKYIQQTDANIDITCDKLDDQTNIILLADRPLLQKSLDIILSLASCFATQKKLTITNSNMNTKSDRLSLEIFLSPFALQKEHAVEFFQLESSVRGSSYAQSLGLAPVVARKILTVFGGDLSMTKHSENSGVISAEIPIVTNISKQAQAGVVHEQ